MLKGFRYRFYPTAEQESLLRRTLGCVRFVYNRALAERSEAWTSGRKSIGYVVQSARLTAWKQHPNTSFLREVSCVPLQQSLRHLQGAYSEFFAKRNGYPSFKRKSSGGSATFVGHGFRFCNSELYLAKMTAPIDIRWSRRLPEGAQPSSVTVTLDPAGRWHVSLLCEDNTIKHLPKRKTAIGIDVGIMSLATLSDGEKIANPKHDERELKRRRTLSRRLARKQKGSKNRLKAKLKLARLHANVSDRRKDHLHKLSTRLVRENQVIVVEDLNVSGMVQNRSLARVISDAAWGEMFRQLEYKSDWYGRDFVKVDRFFPSSKTCSACGFIIERLPLNIRNWTCPKCNSVHDRDINASRNILAAGLAVSACGPDVRQHILRNAVRSGAKQELAEVTK